MKATTRRKVSYVVKLCNEDQAHCLGVNSLAIDPRPYTSTSAGNQDTAEGGVLYSAGRDGIVAGWDLHMPFKRYTATDEHLQQNGWRLDRQIQTSPSKTTCKAFLQMHTDWVNDIVICDSGTSVVSASSDRTIKLWKPYSDTPSVAHTIGWHTDYAKCLTYASHPGWVASGGLDRRIKIWDLEKAEASITLDATPIGHSTGGSSESNGSVMHSTSTSSKCSIYALTVNPSGSLLASGSPEKVVRLWDPKSGKRIGKLTGHTDNIRALLMSDDGQYILSGSSDSTVKLWSVKAQRCITTYETHPDSVWALYSDHPYLKTFYSGSRDGLVIKTEISGQSPTDGDSECIGLFKEDSGVTKIAAIDDTYVWTATSSSSINRWLSVPSMHSRQVLPRSDYNMEIPNSALAKLPEAKSLYASPQAADSFLPSDQLTMYAGSVLSIPISYQDDDLGNDQTIIPLRSAPECTIEGKPGIVSHLVLRNRRHILTKDTNGNVAMWDLTKCLQIKNFGKRDIEEAAEEVNSIESFPAWCSVDTKIGAITVQLHENSCFDCEMYADEVELPNDYSVNEDQRLNVGKWVLVNLFQNFIKRELQYQDEEGQVNYSLVEQTDKPESLKSKTPQSEDRSTPDQQQQQSNKPPSVPPITIPKPKVDIVPPKVPVIAVTTTTVTDAEQSPFLPTSPHAKQFNGGPFTAPPSSSPQSDYFSGAHHTPATPRRESTAVVQIPPPAALPTSPTSPTATTASGNLMNRLKSLSVKAKLSRTPTPEEKVLSSSAESFMPATTTTLTSESATAPADSKSPISEQPKQPIPLLPTPNIIKEQSDTDDGGPQNYSPPNVNDFPPLQIPTSTMIVVAEESAEASTGIDLYRGTVDSLGNDANTIINVAPSWLLSYLLYNKTPSKDTVKLTFVLKPMTGSKLDELPGGPNNRLLANRVLRVRKIRQYICEKLEIDNEDSIELLCGETLLTPTMTLAAIKHHILKASGDIPISYKLKTEAEL